MSQMILKEVTMFNRILIVLMLGLGLQSLNAQNLVDCTYLLEDAKEAYEAGMVELVPELLLECIQTNGLTGESRKEAYKLVINSYLFDLRPADADSLMDDFVMEFPGYRAQNSDPQEFAYMLDAHLIALGINPDQPPEDTVSVSGGRGIFDFFSNRNITKGAGEFGNTLGFNLGGTFSLPTTLEGYSVGNPAGDDSHFGLLPGILAGADGNLILNRKLEASFGLLYDLTRFSYSATPMPFTSYRYVEAQHQLLLPVSIIYKLNPEDLRYCIYFRGGIVPVYLVSATGKGTRSYDADLEDIQVDRIPITDSRVKVNLNLMLGSGIRIPLEHAFIFVEARLNSRLLQSTKDEYRYQNNDLLWELYHVDSDFRVHQLSINGGICWDLTKE
jgi:hypothetical protein